MYIRNQYESKAFQLGILSGLFSVGTCLKLKKNNLQ